MKKRNNNSQSGFSLLEALTAAAIFVIGIIGINAMITMSNQVIENAAVRDQITLTSTMALEDIVSNAEYTSKYKSEDCYQEDSGSNKNNKDKDRWFKIMKDRVFGRISNPKKCKIETEEITKNINNKSVVIGNIVIYEMKITSPDQKKDKLVRRIIRRVNAPHK